MSLVTAPADRRFRRAHVKPGRRRHSWSAIVKPLAAWVAVVAVLALGVYRTTAVALHAGVLQIDKINIHGNERLSKSEVLAVLNGMRGENLVWTDLDAWRSKLLASPWVRDASLRRSLPSTVEVVISERAPIGVGRIGGDMYLIDERGVVIDQYGPHYADFDLPIVDGLSLHPADEGGGVDDGRAELAARVIAALASRPQIAKRLSQVDVSDARNAKVILNGDSALIQLGDDQFVQRLEGYLALASALRDRVANIDSVDLRFEDRIYVRPAATGKKGVGTLSPQRPPRK